MAKSKKGQKKALDSLKQIEQNAAGIDIGADSHWVSVSPDREEQNVREFKCYTPDLYALADWLSQCEVETVVMESTGVYWIPVFQILETKGFKVLLVNSHHVKTVPGRKSDVLDCQWLQQLHSYGLLAGSFRPQDEICILRSYIRHRDKSANGAFFRRLRTRLGSPKAITATAHKLARIFYCLWKGGGEYQDPGVDVYEQKYQQRILKNLQRKADQLGFTIVPQAGSV